MGLQHIQVGYLFSSTGSYELVARSMLNGALLAAEEINASGRGQDPLYIVDGVIINGNLSDLNPRDIENVEVLKGAAASAIYGSKASNGVILITTKRGRVGAPQFAITQRFGGSKISNKYGTRCFSSP